MNKKFIIAFSALLLVIVAAIVAVVGVFAAQQQRVANTFTIKYVANNVSATINSHYQLKDQIGITPFDEGNGISFNAGESSKTKLSTAPDIELTATTNYVVFRFVIRNNNTAGGRSLLATLTDNAVQENVNVYYLFMGTNDGITENGDYIPDTYEGAKTYGTTVCPTEPIEILASQTGIFLIVVEIDDDTLEAQYTSKQEQSVTITLNSAE